MLRNAKGKGPLALPNPLNINTLQAKMHKCVKKDILYIFIILYFSFINF